LQYNIVLNDDIFRNYIQGNNDKYVINTLLNKFSNDINHDELLRPKNVGLSSDNIPQFDKPLDFKESNDFMPYNFDL